MCPILGPLVPLFWISALFSVLNLIVLQADKMLVKNSENLLDAISKMLSAAEATSVKVRLPRIPLVKT